MNKRKQRAEEIQNRIREVLLNEWDPIGVRGEPGAQDEYDSYVGGIYRLLVSGASESQIIERLYDIEAVSMGLPGDREYLKGVAEKLLKLDVSM
jgi:hypothetical protein